MMKPINNSKTLAEMPVNEKGRVSEVTLPPETHRRLIERGLTVFEYGFVFDYTIARKGLPIAGVQQLIPFCAYHGEWTGLT